MLSDQVPSGFGRRPETTAARGRFSEAELLNEGWTLLGLPEGRKRLAAEMVPKSIELIALTKPQALPATEKEMMPSDITNHELSGGRAQRGRPLERKVRRPTTTAEQHFLRSPPALGASGKGAEQTAQACREGSPILE